MRAASIPPPSQRSLAVHSGRSHSPAHIGQPMTFESGPDAGQPGQHGPSTLSPPPGTWPRPHQVGAARNRARILGSAAIAAQALSPIIWWERAPRPCHSESPLVGGRTAHVARTACPSVRQACARRLPPSPCGLAATRQKDCQFTCSSSGPRPRHRPLAAKRRAVSWLTQSGLEEEEQYADDIIGLLACHGRAGLDKITPRGEVRRWLGSHHSDSHRSRQGQVSALGRQHVRVVVSPVYQLVRKPLFVSGVLRCRETAKDAELGAMPGLCW